MKNPFHILSILALTALGGCAYNPSTGAVNTFGQTISDTRAKETVLINAVKDNDEALQFISKNDKFCIDPKSDFAAPTQAILKKENDRISKKVRKAMDFLDLYDSALNQIVKGDSQFVDTLGKIAPNVPNLPMVGEYKGLILAGVGGLELGSQLVAQQMLKNVATDMNIRLIDAVKTLKNDLTELTGGELLAFQKWDECQRVSLIYMRDRAPDNITSSSSVELRDSYLTYLAQKAINIQNPNVVAALDNILVQNKDLKDGKQPDPQNLIKAFTTLRDVKNAIPME